jgi:Holliday junction resolvase-like predicted endonuclease
MEKLLSACQKPLFLCIVMYNFENPSALIEMNLIISILKLTKNGPISNKLLNKDAKIPNEVAEKLLRKLQNEGSIYVQKDIVEADNFQRLKLAVQAIHLGADIENVSSFLRWQEFENIAAVAFERNSYAVKRNFRFKHADRRMEIDIVAAKKPIIVCADCKHWHRGLHPSALRKIVEEQVERTSALAESLPSLSDKIGCASWINVKLVPAVLSLVVGRLKFQDNVPVVAVLQLQDFLNQLPAYVDSLKHFTKS